MHLKGLKSSAEKPNQVLFKAKQVLLHKALEVYLKTSPVKAVVGLESALKNATNTL